MTSTPASKPEKATSGFEPLLGAKAQSSQAPGYVYFLQDAFNDEGPVKVGYSDNPHRRCLHLNRLLKHPCLTIIGAFPGGREQERELHKRWTSHRVLGEWFRPAPEILAAAALTRTLHFAEARDE